MAAAAMRTVLARTMLARTMLATVLLLASCATPIADDDAIGGFAATVYDAAGEPHQPLQVTGDSVHVLVFTSHECPIAKGYSPTLRALAEGWRAQSRVRLFLVHVDPDLTPAAAKQHTAAYELPGTVVLDPSQGLARRCGATITPEAVICTAQGIAYRGRIDDQWRKLGSRAPAASRHDLRDAVRQVLAGQTVPKPHAPAVGCLLPEPRLDDGKNRPICETQAFRRALVSEVP